MHALHPPAQQAEGPDDRYSRQQRLASEVLAAGGWPGLALVPAAPGAPGQVGKGGGVSAELGHSRYL